MNAMTVADKLREIWDNNENIMARIIDIKSDIERSGELSPDDKNRILDTKIECEEIACKLGNLLLEVQVDETANGGIRRSENHLRG